jgi:hypothetical protein
MSLRLRFAVLSSAALIAAGLTAALAVEPLCSVFRSPRHYASHAGAHQRTASTTATALAAPR